MCFEMTFEGVKKSLMAVGIWFQIWEQQRRKLCTCEKMYVSSERIR